MNEKEAIKYLGLESYRIPIVRAFQKPGKTMKDVEECSEAFFNFVKAHTTSYKTTLAIKDTITEGLEKAIPFAEEVGRLERGDPDKKGLVESKLKRERSIGKNLAYYGMYAASDRQLEESAKRSRAHALVIDAIRNSFAPAYRKILEQYDQVLLKRSHCKCTNPECAAIIQHPTIGGCQPCPYCNSKMVPTSKGPKSYGGKER